MKRSGRFSPTREPFKYDPDLQLLQSRVAGPIPFFNPTKAHYRHTIRPDVRFKWTSRNNRKGRHAVVFSHSPEFKHAPPPPTSSSHSVARNIRRMLTFYPVWDVSFDVAFVFTIGSVIWVINAFFVWLPLVRPDTEFTNEELYGGGITAFIGAIVFEVGSVLLMLEAINENRSGCFGWAIFRGAPQHESNIQNTIGHPSLAHCSHHHSDKHNLVGQDHSTPPKAVSDTSPRSWRWWPSASDLRTHYIHSLGFLASFSQLISATIFWISGLTALPGIYNHMSRTVTIILYWVPQILGGIGFIISGTLFMLETQSKWWKPAPKTLGWWVGAWNLVGGVGFTMCPAFGLDKSSWAQWQACLSTFWGSWAFLVGSVLQWYESLEKFPVEVEKR